jgi:adenosine deaminase
MTSASADHLRRLPKVELHCHVEGAARATTIGELAAKNGVGLPVADPAELFRFTDLNQFLGIYDVVCRSLVTADDFHRIAYEACEDGVAAGVRYREMFFSPGFVLKLGVAIETVWEGLSAGVRDANADLDITCRLILDVDKPSGPTHAEEMVAFAAGCDRELLLGVGGDSVERGIDHAAFAPAFRTAAEAGLHRTMHAGEDGPADNIRTAVEVLGVERIDHGFRLLDDPELTAVVVDRGIPVTACPTSNLVIAHVIDTLAEHPFEAQRSRGVHITLNSDDPGMMRWDLADEFVAVADTFGYDLEAMEDLALAALDASWAQPSEKDTLRARMLADFDALRAESGLPARG